MNSKSLLRLFSVLHWLGLAMLAYGVYALWSTDAPDTGAMTLYASLIGLGLLMMGPYPVILFIRWSQKDKQPD